MHFFRLGGMAILMGCLVVCTESAAQKKDEGGAPAAGRQTRVPESGGTESP